MRRRKDRIKYRFFTCVVHPLRQHTAAAAGCARGGGSQLGYNGKLVQVLQWESTLSPREFQLDLTSESLVILPGLKFAHSESGERIQTQRGWLTGQTAVHLRLHSNPDGRGPFRWFSRRYQGLGCARSKSHGHADRPLRLHSRQFDLRRRNSVPLVDCSTEQRGLPSSVTSTAYSTSICTYDEDSRDFPYDHQISNTDSIYNDEDSWSGAHGVPSASRRAEWSALRDEDCVPVAIGPEGARYVGDDYVTLHHLTVDIGTTAFEITLEEELSTPVNGSTIEPVGRVMVLPFNLHRDGSQGIRLVSVVNSNGEVIGTVSVDYLIITSLNVSACDMSLSYSRYWKGRDRTVHVGHRGLGSSHSLDPNENSDSEQIKNVSHITENTINSFATAAEHGADYVEFDVLLSKDEIPVVYHDFHVTAICRMRNSRTLTKLVLPVQDLTADELCTLKLHYGAHMPTQEEMERDDIDPDDLRPFPTLRQVLQRTPETTGFNIELKFPALLAQPVEKIGNSDRDYESLPRLAGGGFGHECYHPCDMNRFVDRVVSEVLKYRGQRHIIFSCFHVDVCTLLSVKQNKYPVLLLTQGVNNHWPDYLDIRTRETYTGSLVCRNHGFLGLSANADELIAKPGLVQRILHERSLVLFVWGPLTSDADVRAKLNRQGVHGIIYDRLHEAGLAGPDEFFQQSRSHGYKGTTSSFELSIVPESTYHPLQTSHASNTSST